MVKGSAEGRGRQRSTPDSTRLLNSRRGAGPEVKSFFGTWSACPKNWGEKQRRVRPVRRLAWMPGDEQGSTDTATLHTHFGRLLHSADGERCRMFSQQRQNVWFLRRQGSKATVGFGSGGFHEARRWREFRWKAARRSGGETAAESTLYRVQLQDVKNPVRSPTRLR